MDRVLVTGGFGYVGGRIVDHLRRCGFDVAVSTRRPQAAAPEWAARVALIDHAQVVAAGGAGALAGFAAVVHLAGMNEVDCAARPDQALLVNGVDSVRLLGNAVEAGVRRFLYFSTAHVYGSPLAGVIDEERRAEPRHPYAISHRVVEDYLLASAERGSIDGIVLRLSNAVGAPMDPAVNRWMLLANDLCAQAVRGDTLVLKSGGVQERDFIPLEDVARAVEHFLADGREGRRERLFNLGAGRSYSVYALAELVRDRAQRVMARQFSITRPEPKAAEATTLHYRTERLLADGFRYTGSLEREIDDTIRLCLRFPHPA
ncbi:SDR family oxidoreductase [Endothiovibrio diazotrophicus]